MSQESVQSNPNAGKGLGIAGFVLGLCALVFSFVPCLGAYAVFPGVLAMILAFVALMQASKANSPKGLIIAGLVVSIIGTGIGGYQYMVLKNLGNQIEDATKNLDLNDVLGDSLSGEISKGLEALSDSLKNK